jgi:hypothetical protein
MENEPVEVVARPVTRLSVGSIRIELPEVAAHAAVSSSSGSYSSCTSSSVAAAAHGRERLNDLISKHASKLSSLRSIVSRDANYEPALHDDIWLLRFLLTHLPKGGIAAAASAATETMAWRRAHGMDDPKLPVAQKVGSVAKMYAALRDPAAISYFVPDADRGLLLVAVPALIDFHKASTTLTEEEQKEAHRLSTEWVFRFCDAATRRTGYLTKYVRIVDLEGLKFSHINREFQRRDSKNSKAIESAYPQLLGAIFLCHAPKWMQTVWRGLRVMMPARVVEKVDFIEPKTSAAERKRLLRWVAPEHLPTFLGGSLEEWPPPSARF